LPAGCGQVVDGNRLIATPYDLSFKVDTEHKVLCTKTLDAKEIQQFRKVCALPSYVRLSSLVFPARLVDQAMSIQSIRFLDKEKGFNGGMLWQSYQMYLIALTKHLIHEQRSVPLCGHPRLGKRISSNLMAYTNHWLATWGFNRRSEKTCCTLNTAQTMCHVLLVGHHMRVRVKLSRRSCMKLNELPSDQLLCIAGSTRGLLFPDVL
jgi:hypothetical protein